MFFNLYHYKAVLLWKIPSISDITGNIGKAISGTVSSVMQALTGGAAEAVENGKNTVESGLASTSDALTTKIMNGVVSWGSNTIGQMCSFLTDSFTSNFAPNINSFFGMFGCNTDPTKIHWLTFSYSPDGTLLDAFRLFAYIGIILAILIYILELIASAMADYTDAKDTPIQLSIRFFMSIFTINFSTGIISYFFDLAENVWNYCTTMAFSYGSAALNTGSVSLGNLIMTMVSGAATGGVSVIAALIINIICAILLTKEILKYMVEIVERYFVACVLYMIFPAIAGTYVSKKTSMVEAYFKMLICQLILIICNLLFMKLVILLMCALIAKNADSSLLPGTTIFYTIIIIGFLRVAERIDQYMRSLGLNPAQTGGNLLDTGMLGAHMLMSDMSKAGRGVGGYLNNAAANAMRRGNFAQAEGLRRAAGVIDPRYAAGSVGGRTGAGASGQDMVNFAKKSGMDANAAFGAQAVKDYMAEGLAKGQGQARNDFNSLTDDNKGDMLKNMFGNNLDNAMFGEKPNNIEATKDGLHFSSDGKDYALSRNNLGAAIGQVKDANGNTWYLSGANPNGTAMRNAQQLRNVQDGAYAGGKGMQQFEASLGMSRSKIAAAAGLNENAIAGYQKSGNKFDIMDQNGNVIGFANTQKDGTTSYGATKLAQKTGALASQQDGSNEMFGNNSGLNHGATMPSGSDGKPGVGNTGSQAGGIPTGNNRTAGTTSQSIKASPADGAPTDSLNGQNVRKAGMEGKGPSAANINGTSGTGTKNQPTNGINSTPAAGTSNNGTASSNGVRNGSVMNALKRSAEADSMPGNGMVEKGSSLYNAAVKAGFLDPSKVDVLSLSDDGKGGYLAENADAIGSDRVCHFTPVGSADDAAGYKFTATDENGVMYGLSGADNDQIDDGENDTTVHQLFTAADSAAQSINDADNANDVNSDQIAGFMNAFIKGHDENAVTMDLPERFDGESIVGEGTNLPHIDIDGNGISFAYPDGNTYTGVFDTDERGNPSFSVFDASSDDRSNPLETWSQTGNAFNWSRIANDNTEERMNFYQQLAAEERLSKDSGQDNIENYSFFTEEESKKGNDYFQESCRDEEQWQKQHKKRP